jgi:transposase
MKRFIQGNNRYQVTLFPEYLEDYVSENNPVRVVDAFIEQLDLGKLGFNRIEPAVTGRPSYLPSVTPPQALYMVTSTESSPAAV